MDTEENPMSEPYPFRFNTDREGLAKVLGELELQIMEVLWRRDCATVRDVYQRLKEFREVAYTTIMTVMSRLFEKGLLVRDKVGNAYSYRATSSRDDFAESAVRRIVTSLLKEFTPSAMSQFVDYFDQADPDKLDELARLIAAKKKGQ